MTVIRDKQAYTYPRPNSAATSDTESLHLASASASDTESINEEHLSTPTRIRVYRAVPVKLNHFEELISVKKSSGKKKIRRYQNRCVLQTLNEDEEENECVMEPYKTPFTRLFEDKTAMDYWQEFIKKSENEQKEIIHGLSNTVPYNNKNYNVTIDKPGKISSRIKRTFKIRKNLSIEAVKDSEEDLIAFFRDKPSDIYIKYPPTSFDRLLLHGIAQYHKLISISMSDEAGTKRSVKVYNILENWLPSSDCLSDFIKQLRKFDSN